MGAQEYNSKLIKQYLSEVSTKHHKVTDHCMIRYLDRVAGINLIDLKDKIERDIDKNYRECTIIRNNKFVTLLPHNYNGEIVL